MTKGIDKAIQASKQTNEFIDENMRCSITGSICFFWNNGCTHFDGECK